MFDIAPILYAENEKEMIEAFLEQDIRYLSRYFKKIG